MKLEYDDLIDLMQINFFALAEVFSDLLEVKELDRRAPAIISALPDHTRFSRFVDYGQYETLRLRSLRHKSLKFLREKGVISSFREFTDTSYSFHEQKYRVNCTLKNLNACRGSFREVHQEKYLSKLSQSGDSGAEVERLVLVDRLDADLITIKDNEETGEVVIDFFGLFLSFPKEGKEGRFVRAVFSAPKDGSWQNHQSLIEVPDVGLSGTYQSLKQAMNRVNVKCHEALGVHLFETINAKRAFRLNPRFFLRSVANKRRTN